MFLQEMNLAGTWFTAVVITLTAIAALWQLHHMRRSNQIAVLSDLFERLSAPEFVSARQFVFSGLPEKMQDPAFRHQVVSRAARSGENTQLIANAIIVGSYFEEMGLLAKTQLVDRDLLCDMHSDGIVIAWDALSEFTAIVREAEGKAAFENFEYLTVLAKDWLAKYPSGSYPANVRRLLLSNKWHSADKQYAATLAT
jgi:hypothetical protein